MAGLLDSHGERGAGGGHGLSAEPGARSVTVIGRLKPGVTPEQATGNLNAIAAELAKEYPATDNGLALRLIHPGLWGTTGK